MRHALISTKRRMLREAMSGSKQFKSDLVAAVVTRQEHFPCHAGYLVIG
jgi:hypothetical protein